MVYDVQLSLWADCMSGWTVLCLTMTSTCQHTDVAGNSLRFQCQLLLGFSRLPNLTTTNSKCPDPLFPHLTSLSAFRKSSQFKKFAVRHIHLPICLGLFAGIASGLFREMCPELSLTVWKRGVKSVNDWPTSLDEVWNWPRCPHTPLFFNASSIWLNRSKTFYQECGLHVSEKQNESLFKSAIRKRSTGNDLFSTNHINW